MRHILIATGLLLSGLPMAAAESDAFSEAKFRELHAALTPSPDEPWRTIPWKISLLEAQQQAARDRKPIFIWAMDGHPLGCT